MAIIYFGISQSLFSAAYSLTKRPLGYPNKILGGWLIVISLMFILNLIKQTNGISGDLWPISVNISISYPIFLFLYTKYIIRVHATFNKKDLLHFIPLLVGITIVALFYNTRITSLSTLIEHYSDKMTARTIVGYFFDACLWFYSIRALILIYKYKKQIENFYSFKSYRINLIWLQVVVVSFLVFYHVIIIISAYYTDGAIINHIEIFRSGVLLIFVYILSFGGLRQRQLISENNTINLNQHIEPHKSTELQYTKSSLKDDQAEEYLKTLVEFMNTTDIWKDNELSITKLSEQSGIARHYITQVLNQYLHKNFNTFVNEYRIEYAKKMMLSNKYSNWSIIAIAYESGFNSKATFNSFFKKYTGKTPSEFKASPSLS